MTAVWQCFTRDPEDVHPPVRCAARSPVGRGLCLRRLGHPPDWHEGRSATGALVSWPVRTHQNTDV